MVKHTQTICRLLATNYLSVFEHFVGMALKRVRELSAYGEESFMRLMLITEACLEPSRTSKMEFFLVNS